MALRTVGVRLTAEVSSYMTNMRQAGAATRQFTGEMDKAAKSGHLDRVATSAGVAGLALGGMAGYAIKAAADFDKAMSNVRAATHAGAADIAKLRQAALQAGKDTAYSATEAADGITELSKAGVGTADILSGGLKGALDLAAAGQLDVGEAAETAASAMVQFKLSGKDIPHIADLLAAGAGKAQGSVHDMGFALKQSGLVASQFGLSVEDTTGALAAFASAGLIGSDAGTSFKTMLLALANPAEKTRDLMEDLGIQAYDAGGKFVGITNLAEQLRTKLGGLSQAQRDAAMAQIFGSDAIRSANVLYQQGAAGIQSWIDKVNDAGYASETARIQTDNLAGDIERLKGSIETLAIQSGSGANGGLRQLVQIADGLVDKFGKLPPAVGSTVTVLAGLSGAALLLGAGWIKVRRTTAEFRAELEAMGPAGERAAAGMSRLGSAATKVGLVFAALEAAGAVINQFQKDLNPQVEAMAVGLQKYAAGGQLAGESSRVLGKNLEDLKVGFSFLADEDNSRRQAVKHLQQGLESLVPGLDGTNTSLAKTKERIAAMDAALAQMAAGGNTQAASEVFQKLASELATGGVSMAEFRKQFPQYAAALETAGAATSDTAKKTGGLNSALSAGADKQQEYKTATDAAAAASRGQRDALAKLAAFMKAEADPVFGLIEAQKTLKEAQDKASAAIKKHGRNSEEAKSATRNLALAAIDLQGKVGSLGQTFDGRLSPSLMATLRAGKLTDAELKILEKQFKDARVAAEKYDDKYEAKTSAPGAKQAKKDLDNAYTAANHFAGPYRANVSVTNYASAKSKLLDLISLQYEAEHPGASKSDIAENRREKARFLATGGPVYGPGTATSDSIPARLSAGEHVWTAAEVQALGGQGAMMSLRAAVRTGKRVEYGDETPGFAGGGAVIPYRVNMGGMKVPTALAFPGGAPGYKWMERAIRAAFPGLAVISDFRPGAVTLTGNRSYHAVGRAVDYPPSKPLAEWINLHYKAATKELITPWNSLNIHNGARHAYSGAVWNQHNFAGGNAHDHWAMRNGGTITEPIFGVGASGRTYSFGENYQPERVSPMWHGGGGSITNINVTITAPVGSSPRDIGRQVSDVLDSYCRGGGRVQLRGSVTP